MWKTIVAALSILLLPLPSRSAVKFEELARQVKEFQAAGDDAKILYALQEMERTDPALYRLNSYPYLAGLVAVRMGRDDLARASFDTARGLPLLSSYATRELAGIEQRRENYAEQRRLLEQLLQSRAGALADEASYQHAMSYLAEKSYEKALAELARLPRRDVLYERIQCLLALGRLDDAHRLFGASIRSGGHGDGPQRALGLIELHETSETLEHLSDDELTLRGDLYSANRNFERALFYYRMLHDERGIASPRLLYSIGRALDGTGNKADALAWFQGIEGSVTGTYRFYAIRSQGEIQFRRQDFRAAEFQCLRALPLAASEPEDLSVRLRILNCQLLSGLKDRAAATVQDILRRHSAMAYRLSFLTLRDLASGSRLPDAQKMVDTMLEKEPAEHRAELLFWRGWIQAKSGNLGESASAYDALLRQYPRSFYAILAERRFQDPSLGAVASGGYRGQLAEVLATREKRPSGEAQAGLSYLLHRYPAERAETAHALEAIYDLQPRYREWLRLDLLPERDVILGATAPAQRTTAAELLFLNCHADAAREMDAARGGRLVSLQLLLTIADQYQRGSQSYMAMLRAESMIHLMPRDYEFELLPRRLRELLYPLNYESLVARSAPPDLDLALFYALIREESRFDVRARSHAGARGLLQFIPQTAAAVQKELGGGNLADEDLYDPAVSIQLGAYYVAKLSRQFGQSPAPVLASYNAGEEQAKLWLRMAGASDIHQYLSEVNYEETRTYIMRIMTDYYRYRSLYPALSGESGAASRPLG